MLNCLTVLRILWDSLMVTWRCLRFLFRVLRHSGASEASSWDSSGFLKGCLRIFIRFWILSGCCLGLIRIDQDLPRISKDTSGLWMSFLEDFQWILQGLGGIYLKRITIEIYRGLFQRFEREFLQVFPSEYLWKFFILRDSKRSVPG